jgi:hypothetical protein
MIPNHLNLNPFGNARLAGIALALAAILGSTAYLRAYQPETPIVIADGSLRMTASVAWSSFGGSPDSAVHTSLDKYVASVQVAGTGFPSAPIQFTGQKVEVTVTYANTTTIYVFTGSNGKVLTVNHPSNQFHQGASVYEKVHNNPNGSITHVTVKNNGVVVPGFDNNASPHTTVTIKYDR